MGPEKLLLCPSQYRRSRPLHPGGPIARPMALPLMTAVQMMMSSQREIVFAASGTHPDPGAHGPLSRIVPPSHPPPRPMTLGPPPRAAVKAWLTARGYKYTTDKSCNDVLVVGTGKNTMPTNYKVRP